MAKEKGKTKEPKESGPSEPKSPRNYPKHTLQDALVLPQKVQDEMGGMPMNKLLLADAIGLSPSSSNFKYLLSSSFRYGLTDGTEKADIISLTEVGASATQQGDQQKRLQALRKAAMTPPVFGQFFKDYANKKLPSSEMLPKILQTQYKVPNELTAECSDHIAKNGRFVEMIRDIGGSPHILLDADPTPSSKLEEADSSSEDFDLDTTEEIPIGDTTPPVVPAVKPTGPTGPKPIFVGHGKNKGPLQQLQTLLSTFQIPHKVVVYEPHLGRPIPQKVRDTIEECGSAILIFTKDELLFDKDGNEVWRPSENVVHELGATSFKYGDRIVIFKETGLHFPTNFESIGYIEFESGELTARTAELLKELIGFGLVKVTPTQ